MYFIDLSGEEVTRQNFTLISLFKHDFLVLADLLECGGLAQFKGLENRMCKAIPFDFSGSTLKMALLM